MTRNEESEGGPDWAALLVATNTAIAATSKLAKDSNIGPARTYLDGQLGGMLAIRKIVFNIEMEQPS